MTTARQPSLRRSAFTLIEVIATIAISSFVLVSVAAAITSLNRVDRTLRAELPSKQGLMRVALQFRSDVHLAREAAVVSEGPESDQLQLQLYDGRVVSYQPDGNDLRRFVRRDSQLERQESFSLPQGSEIVWVTPADSKLVTMVIRRQLGKIPGSDDDLQSTTVVAGRGSSLLTGGPRQ